MPVENFAVEENDLRSKVPLSELAEENIEKTEAAAATGDDGVEVGVTIEEGYGEVARMDTSSSDEEVQTFCSYIFISRGRST